MTKKANLKPVEVTAIESADKSGQTRKIEDWVKNIKELHKNKPRPQVSYSKNMPDIETLMQEWPAELEDTLKHLQLPDGVCHSPLACNRVPPSGHKPQGSGWRRWHAHSRRKILSLSPGKR